MHSLPVCLEHSWNKFMHPAHTYGFGQSHTKNMPKTCRAGYPGFAGSVRANKHTHTSMRVSQCLPFLEGEGIKQTHRALTGITSRSLCLNSHEVSGCFWGLHRLQHPVCVHTCVCTSPWTCTSLHRLNGQVCAWTCVCACVYVCTRVRVPVLERVHHRTDCMSKCVHICVYMCTDVCVCVCVHISQHSRRTLLCTAHQRDSNKNVPSTATTCCIKRPMIRSLRVRTVRSGTSKTTNDQ
jgi:hypothetical protein